MVMRRGLMLIGKILQNLANNILFGKEAHMTPLNKFLEDQIVNVNRFLSEINVSSPIGIPLVSFDRFGVEISSICL